MTNVRIVFLGTVLFGLIILAKILMLQFGSDRKWKRNAEERLVKPREVKATRGNIYSDNGSLYATSLPFYHVAFDPMVSQKSLKSKRYFDDNIDALDSLLCDFFKDHNYGWYKAKIKRKIKAGKSYVRLNSKRISYPDKKVMKTWPIFKRGQMKGGVIFEKEERRFKPFDPLVSRTIGTYNVKLEKGVTGIEYSYDSLLRGQDGEALFVKIGANTWKPLHDENEINPRNGYDIVTTLDVNLQDVAENALLYALKKHNAKNGSVVLMEVKTGKIKALANLDKRESGTYYEGYNHAVAKRTEPGSTFKLASLMAVFEHNPSLKLTDTIDCEGGKKKFFDRWMRDSHKNGRLSIQDVFAQSSNVGVAKLAMQHFYNSKKNQMEFSDYLTQLGLRQDLNFQLKGYAQSNIKSPESEYWSGVSIPWMAHGYELEVSPLQILAFYNAVANDGKFIEPYLVDEIREANTVIQKYRGKVYRERICSESTLEKAQKMLEVVVENGTASSIRSGRYKIAGKTGTAKKIVDGKYVTKYYSSFAGYFPADNPKYSCIVTVDDPKQNGFYGSTVAAPVFRKIADNIYNSDIELHDALPQKFTPEKGVFPLIQAGNLEDMNKVCQELNINLWEGNSDGSLEWARAKRDDELKAIKWKPLVEKNTVIPDVRGMVLRDVYPMLENLGLKVEVEGRGRVVSQSLVIGSQLIVGSKIKLKLSE